jgi:hypothetical protein
VIKHHSGSHDLVPGPATKEEPATGPLRCDY